MCDVCVTEAVKERMLSRRDLFRSAGAATVAASAGVMASAPPALAKGHSKVVDLTHTLTTEFPTYGGTPGISFDQKAAYAKDKYNLFHLTVNEHAGTHLDAPLHFSADGQSVDEVPIEKLVCPLCVIDIREKTEKETEAAVTPEDLKAWIAKHGPIPPGACVAMLSGWEKHLGTPKFRNADAQGKQSYPGFTPDAAKMLLEESEAAGLAVDTLSADVGSSSTYDVHYTWLPANRWHLECVANLAETPASGATIVVGAPKHKGGSGGQTRALALI